MPAQSAVVTGSPSQTKLTKAGVAYAAERWFRRRGTPTLIHGYSLRKHVLPSVLPFAAGIGACFMTLFAAVPNTGPTAARLWVICAGFFGYMLLAVVNVYGSAKLVTAARAVMLVLAVVWPFATPFVAYSYDPGVLGAFLWIPTGADDYWDEAVADNDFADAGTMLALSVVNMLIVWIAVNAAACLLVYYGIATIVRRALADILMRRNRPIGTLGRTLPAMLFLTLLGLLNADVWLLADRIEQWHLVLALLSFAAVGFLAVRAQAHDEGNKVLQIGSEHLLEWISARKRGTPLEHTNVSLLCLKAPHLNNRQVTNLTMVMAARQLTSALTVGVGTFVCLIVLGILLISESTAATWLQQTPSYWLSPLFPKALVNTAALLGGFATLHFAVASMNDPAYRQRFLEPALQDIEQALALRAIYDASATPSSGRSQATGTEG